MNIFRNIIFIAIGLIIASTLIQHTNITANSILIAGAALLALSLLASIIAYNSANQPTSSKTKRKPAKVKSGNTVNGTVKWFNKTKGFGFITQSNGDDVFVHQTSITSKPSILREGQSVTMSVVKDAKGPQAENVKVA